MSVPVGVLCCSGRNVEQRIPVPVSFRLVSRTYIQSVPLAIRSWFPTSFEPKVSAIPRNGLLATRETGKGHVRKAMGCLYTVSAAFCCPKVEQLAP